MLYSLVILLLLLGHGWATLPSCSNGPMDYRTIFSNSEDYSNITASSSFQIASSVGVGIDDYWDSSVAVFTTEQRIYVSVTSNYYNGNGFIFMNVMATLPQGDKIAIIFPSTAQTKYASSNSLGYISINYWVIWESDLTTMKEVTIFTHQNTGSYSASFSYTGKVFTLPPFGSHSLRVRKALQNYPCNSLYLGIEVNTILLSDEVAIIFKGDSTDLPTVNYLAFSNNGTLYRLLDGFLSLTSNSDGSVNLWYMTFILYHDKGVDIVVYRATDSSGILSCPQIPSISGWFHINTIHTSDEVQTVTTASAYAGILYTLVLSSTKTELDTPLSLIYYTNSNVKYGLTGADQYINNSTRFGSPGFVNLNCAVDAEEGYWTTLNWINQDSGEVIVGPAFINQDISKAYCLTNLACSMGNAYQNRYELNWRLSLMNTFANSNCNTRVHINQVIPWYSSTGQFQLAILGYYNIQSPTCLTDQSDFNMKYGYQESQDNCSCQLATGLSCCTFDIPCQSPCGGSSNNQTYCVNTGAVSCCCEEMSCSCYY